MSVWLESKWFLFIECVWICSSTWWRLQRSRINKLYFPSGSSDSPSELMPAAAPEPAPPSFIIPALVGEVIPQVTCRCWHPANNELVSSCREPTGVNARSFSQLEAHVRANAAALIKTSSLQFNGNFSEGRNHFGGCAAPRPHYNFLIG